jgi:ATP-dependent protease ClpP protease subunit
MTAYKNVLFFLTLMTFHFSFGYILVPGKVEYQDTTEDNKAYVVIRISGTISYPMSGEVASFLAKLPARVPLMLHLNSQGGSVQEGRKIIALLQAEKAQRQVWTLVRNGETCGSMCVPLFMQGSRRLSAETAAFMFHGATTGYTNVPEAAKTQEIIEIMTDAGASKAWFEELKKTGVFTLPGEYWISAKSLVDEGSQVITELTQRHLVEQAWSVPFDPNLKPR